ncbi:MAG: hypothetical protein M1818_003372 [Claussenomyces sp. TS43310]|nr:MAG: hypothetical protein M1818_003372 [Claussenomyces sp. TS43310]
MDFPGVALVTGAASGIGRATAILYAKEGCKSISISDLNQAGLDETKKVINENYAGATVRTTVCDISNEDSVQKLIDGTVEQFGRLDYCGNVAGIILLGAQTAEMATSFFDKHYEVNLRGLFFCERAELQVMMKQEPLTSKDTKYPARGSIVNVSSMAGLVGKGEMPAYSSSKHGVIGLSKADGMFYGQHGIRINALCPGLVATPILINSGNNISAEALVGAQSKENSLRRFGDPEELAQSLVWLTSGRASYVTATTLAVNGGQIGA